MIIRSLICAGLIIAAGCKQRAESRLDEDQARTAPSFSVLMEAAKDPAKGVRFVPVPLIRQSRNFTCGAAALQSVLAYWGDEFREGQLQRILKSNNDDGTSYKELVKVVKDLGDTTKAAELYSVEADDEEAVEETMPPGSDKMNQVGKEASVPTKKERGAHQPYSISLYEGRSKTMRPPVNSIEPNVPVDGLTLAELERFVDAGKPVIVLIQAWSSFERPKWSEAWDDGHYVVAIGYDADRLYFMDPSTTGNYTYIDKQEFLERWHDVDVHYDDATDTSTTADLNHFALVISRDAPDFDIQSVLKME